MGSEASAACGGASEPSEWQRSAECYPASPGVAFAGHRNRKQVSHITINRKNSTISGGVQCSHYLSSRVGQVLSCRSQVSRGHLQAEKNSTISGGVQCSHYLSSRAVARQVLSAQMSLTSVFGMGTGGPSSQSIRTLYLYQLSLLHSLVTHTGFEPMLTA